MREILFRGKTEKGEWVEGYLFKGKFYLDETDITAITPLDLTLYPRCEISEYEIVIPETIGQFTGLTDKNGKKIFEGDIIKLYLRDDVTTVGDIRYSEEDCRFKFWEDFEYPYGFDITTPFEVIGNIHDNPELLGE